METGTYFSFHDKYAFCVSLVIFSLQKNEIIQAEPLSSNHISSNLRRWVGSVVTIITVMSYLGSNKVFSQQRVWVETKMYWFRHEVKRVSFMKISPYLVNHLHVLSSYIWVAGLVPTQGKTGCLCLNGGKQWIR